MKKIVLLLILLLPITAFAINNSQADMITAAGFTKLPVEKQTEILKNIAEASAQLPKQEQINKLNDVKQWVDFGSALGQGLAGTARELGIAANEFINTPAGTLATYILMWKLIGADLMHVGGALIIWLVGFISLRVLFKASIIEKIKYKTELSKITKSQLIDSIEYDTVNGETVAGWITAGIVVFAVGAVTLFTM